MHLNSSSSRLAARLTSRTRRQPALRFHGILGKGEAESRFVAGGVTGTQPVHAQQNCGLLWRPPSDIGVRSAAFGNAPGSPPSRPIPVTCGEQAVDEGAEALAKLWTNWRANNLTADSEKIQFWSSATQIPAYLDLVTHCQ
jgi:hypothetical protein